MSTSSSWTTRSSVERFFRVCSEKKEHYPNFSAGLNLAMTEFRDFWQEATMEVYQLRFQVPVNPKREPEIPEVLAGRGKRARQNANKAVKLTALEEQIRQLQAGATTSSTPSCSKGDKGGKASGKSRGPSVTPRPALGDPSFFLQSWYEPLFPGTRTPGERPVGTIL